ncbi:MAG: hypothetical protein DCF15_00805 [Phormidesmis priestleyi]|uniref:SLH domain-containing protein n=1 Tax=Phormidesmis priestleyi TaxID=268141 RepID=A0A2W4Y315_9CYAN|nr:MAG: hypothetical protein DCF15_00805 [Phormidesmis priestleyi]
MTSSTPPNNDPDNNPTGASRRPESDSEIGGAEVGASAATGSFTGPSRPLSFDEMVALLIAFLSLGTVLFWGLTRSNTALFKDSLTDTNSTLVAPNTDSATPESPTELGTAQGARPRSTTNTNPPLATLSAREQLAAQAAARREANQRPQQSLWDSMRAGTAGAAGVAGITAATDGAAATSPETAVTTSPTAAPTTSAAPNSVALSEAATAPPKAALNFKDVPDNYWAKPYIDALSSRGIISGFQDGNYRPDMPVTRAQIAMIVSKTFDLTTDKENLAFSDVKDDYWARESIGEVVRGGFMTGFPNKTFDPNAPVTRAQALTTLVTGLNAAPPSNVQAALSRYADANAIPPWATEKIAAATASSYVVNYPDLNQLDPTTPTTRAELAAIIYQALVKEGAVAPIESEYVVKP